ncbi:hypothetical protein BH23VER1_BH23VER1_22220 [soil metagenome]
MTAAAGEAVRLAASAPALATRLSEATPALDHATPAAWSFLCALAAHHHAARRIWILCPDIKTQERIHAELIATWGLAAHFFPEQEVNTFADSLPDPDLTAERLSVLHQIRSSTDPIVLLEASLDEDVPSPNDLARDERPFATGDELDLDRLLAALEAAGYERSPQVAERGQFSLRGGILDVFSWRDALPVRLELFDLTLDSIRTFDIHSQTSITRLPSTTLLLTKPSESPARGSGSNPSWQKLAASIDHGRDLVIALGPLHDESARCHLRILEGATPTSPPHPDVEDFSTACHESPLGGFEAGDFILQEAKRQAFSRQLNDWHEAGWRVVMVFNNEGEIDRFRELASTDPSLASRVGSLQFLQFATGLLSRGFTFPAAKLAVLSDAEVFGRYQHARAPRRFVRDQAQPAVRGAATDLRDITEGDYVVHIDFGIARYQGLVRHAPPAGDGAQEDALVLEFADRAKLYVPLPHAHLVSRYVGAGKLRPNLSKLGEGRWTRARQAAEKSIEDYAGQLLSIQAERQTLTGFAHPADSKWQLEFENSFVFKETPDQLRAIEDTKRDMEDGRPMDRLICGDVGFGKTEIAIRAAFKAVMGGKQVAILVPTTVLAQQHFEIFRERMSDYPVTIGLLSRFRTGTQQRKTVQDLLGGSVDIVVGTHRLISRDVAYKDLGLVIIDEEQRFGVKHKERFKTLFRRVDVLTLSATPIPRTLYLSLMGARDMSTIDTPPPNRIPVHTSICPYDERVIRSAIEREVARGGQVFFLHNRVQSIDLLKLKIQKLCPGVRVLVGHGQMEQGVLEEVMHAFVRGEADVLLCTTIIESGVDIPNANTILIDRADRFGLADLYQLRGRVGRAGTRAYAILMLPRDLMGTTGDARKRINAIKQYTSLGSGFKIAMRDLEIRGAGNLLGLQQSGHIAAVGFDLYCKLLKQSVSKLQGKAGSRRTDTTVHIDFLCLSEPAFLRAPLGDLPAFIPSSFMGEASQRISAYRDLAEAGTLTELRAIARHWRDRFGLLPDAAENLLTTTELRITASHARISSVEIKGPKLILVRNGDFILLDGKFPRLAAPSPAERLRQAVAMVKTL